MSESFFPTEHIFHTHIKKEDLRKQRISQKKKRMTSKLSGAGGKRRGSPRFLEFERD